MTKHDKNCGFKNYSVDEEVCNCKTTDNTNYAKLLKELNEILMYESRDFNNNGVLWIRYSRLRKLIDKFKASQKKGEKQEGEEDD